LLIKIIFFIDQRFDTVSRIFIFSTVFINLQLTNKLVPHCFLYSTTDNAKISEHDDVKAFQAKNLTTRGQSKQPDH